MVSGSAAAALRRQSLESGAGRFTDFQLPPLAFCEFAALTGREADLVDDPEAPVPRVRSIDALNRAFLDYLNYGGFPEVATNPAVRAQPERYVRGDILDKVLLRDLPALYGVDDTRDLARLFATIAFNTGQEVNLERLAQEAGLAKNTLKKYLGYLEAAFLVFRLPRVDRSARRFRRETHFKVHVTDPSLRAALFGPIGAEDRAAGPIVETAVVAQYRHLTQAARLCYARWDRGEADLVTLNGLEEPAEAMEIKWSDRPVERPEEITAFLDFCRRHDLMHGRARLTSRSRLTALDLDGVDVTVLPAALEAWRAGRDAIDMKLMIDRLFTDGPADG
jgi:hypothetical protein